MPPPAHTKFRHPRTPPAPCRLFVLPPPPPPRAIAPRFTPTDIDPFKLASRDLSPFTDTIKELVESEHPVLSMAAKHFFEKRHGKRFRPTIVALMGKGDEVKGRHWGYLRSGGNGRARERETDLSVLLRYLVLVFVERQVLFCFVSFRVSSRAVSFVVL